MTFLKNRPQGKKMGTILLVALIIISLAEIIFRAVNLTEFAFTTSNFGEQLTVIAFAVIILILNSKGKDRACYICYGAWISYFVLDQLFELPGMIFTMLSLFGEPTGIVVIEVAAIFIRVLGMIGIIIIGIILGEYMIDGTINNRIFNIVSCVTVLLLAITIVGSTIYVITTSAPAMFQLVTFNALYRIAMVHLLTYFAYDSAKMQLKKTKLS